MATVLTYLLTYLLAFRPRCVFYFYFSFPAVLALSEGDRALEMHWLRLLGPAGAKFIGCGPSGGSGLLKSVFPLGVFPSVACVIV